MFNGIKPDKDKRVIYHPSFCSEFHWAKYAWVLLCIIFSLLLNTKSFEVVVLIKKCPNSSKLKTLTASLHFSLPVWIKMILELDYCIPVGFPSFNWHIGQGTGQTLTQVSSPVRKTIFTETRRRTCLSLIISHRITELSRDVKYMRM